MPRRPGVIAILGAFMAAAVVSAACSGTDDGNGPPPLSTGSSSTRDAGPRDTGSASDAMVDVETSAGATTYKGTLDTTKAVPFGGTPYCAYTITLKDIEIEIAALESGDVIGAAVKNLAVEGTPQTDPPCPHQPMAPSMQRFALTTVTKTASGATLAFEGASTNRPETSLVIDLTRVGVTYEASAGWKRSDQTPPLVWEVRAKLTLAAQ